MAAYVKFLHGFPAFTSVREMWYVHCATYGFVYMVYLHYMLSVVLTSFITAFVGVYILFQPRREQLPVCPTCFN